MITFETDLYIDTVHPRGEFEQKIDCRADKDESAVKYPQKITISISKQKFDKFDSDFGANDKLHVKLYPVTRNGVSKTTNRPYSITDLKVVELRIAERGAAPAQDNTATDDDALPF